MEATISVEHLFTLGTLLSGSYIEFGCCQTCGAIVLIGGQERETSDSLKFFGPKKGTGLNVTLTAEDHMAWHQRTGT